MTTETDWIPQIGDRIKAHHRDTYRPLKNSVACEVATVHRIWYDRRTDRIQVAMTYDNNAADFTPLECFHPDYANGNPAYVKHDN